MTFLSLLSILLRFAITMFRFSKIIIVPLRLGKFVYSISSTMLLRCNRILGRFPELDFRNGMTEAGRRAFRRTFIRGVLATDMQSHSVKLGNFFNRVQRHNFETGKSLFLDGVFIPKFYRFVNVRTS